MGFDQGTGITRLSSQQSGSCHNRIKIHERDEPLRFDVLVNDCVLVEVKAVDDVHPIHKATLLSYMRLLDIPIGLIINFHNVRLTDGVSRLILRSADQ
jgi:GxxExxY protein